MSSRKKFSLFMRAAVHDVVEKITANTAVIQQRVTFCRGAVSDNVLSVLFCLDQKFEQAALRSRDSLGEQVIRLNIL